MRTKASRAGRPWHFTASSTSRGSLHTSLIAVLPRPVFSTPRSALASATLDQNDAALSYHLRPLPVFALLIISKAGSLVYHRTFPTTSSAAITSPTSENPAPTTGTLGLPGTSTLTTNDYLVLAGTFHGVHAITKSLTPKVPLHATANPARASDWTLPEPGVAASGIETMESSFFRLTVFQTLTGTKFLLFTDPSMPNIDVIMKGIYERYADFVCKNPFWQMEMPIRIESWERKIGEWLTRR